jgi:hypothetical protein
MNNPRIIICTTFRDFKGTKNDDIQRSFLKSIKRQNYKNFELVVSLFGEMEVENELRKFDFKSFFYRNNSCKYRYSLSEVVLNAINYAEKNYTDNYIILWTTCDIILEDNFFYNIAKNYRVNIIGTSHPHISYSSIEDYKKNKFLSKKKLFSGFDLIYFDKYFLKNKGIIDSLNENIYNNWGVFEHFLISLSELSFRSKKINIYEVAKIHKIENDRGITDEPNYFLINSHKQNSLTFKKFLKKNNISEFYFIVTLNLNM